MEKAEHAERLRAAMAARSMSNEALAAAVGVRTRSVTNWRTASNLPLPAEREKLRRLFPGYDAPGDPVEVAIMSAANLTEDRRYALVGTYKRLLREQSEGETA